MDDNDVAVEAWNSVLFDKFVRFKHLLIGGWPSPAGEIIRLAGVEGERLQALVVSGLRAALARYEKPIGIWAPSSTGCITSRNPA
jgi:hypothetical protein